MSGAGWWECSLAAISQTTTHVHGHHKATMGLAGVSLGRELRALDLSHTASVRRGTAAHGWLLRAELSTFWPGEDGVDGRRR